MERCGTSVGNGKGLVTVLFALFHVLLTGQGTHPDVMLTRVADFRSRMRQRRDFRQSKSRDSCNNL